ncbi:uncharacterized SAM-binding protein YcdF (DUF218 family) [Antricoccus suffuscus]|uniref:Uncharacterized SAM-binding protein YcdF (DUF218 family) n=1 Tax=Antricoccus suffuscus TaxID=1629062 RepID=A0A2T1A6D3_9ACTN|nr:YdcF family protein [Antricoccus suffuscus]PRZ44037.1 uncharacterized SAM-binding protein YcdF (DUF218 family) [Antricoccus suffuscus]
MRRHPFLAGICALLIVWLIACYFYFVAPAVDHPKHADAVVVLGGAPDRLPVGQKLVAQGIAPTLVVSNSPGTENARANKECKTDTSPDVICFVPSPDDTRGEAHAIAKLAAQHGWKSIVVVTSTYHITRARVLVEQATPIKVYMVASKPKASVLAWAWHFIHETGGMIDALLRPGTRIQG